MAFCANCGAPLQVGARFCRECGNAVLAAGPAATSVPVQVSPQAMPQPVAPVYPPVAYAQAAQPGVTVPPVDPHPAVLAPRMTVGDYVRDGLAAFALIASLFMVWQYYSGDVFGNVNPIAATRIDVILITLVSLVSLGVPYLWRAGVFGPSWNYAKTQDVRVLANLPYAVLVLVYLVIELITHKGLGPAVAFGLAGAVLAAQPRQAEIVAADPARNKRWIGVVVGLAAVVAVLTVVQIGEALLTRIESYGYITNLIVVIVLAMTSVVVLASIAIGISRSENTWRLVGIGLGVFAGFFALLSLSPQITMITTGFNGVMPAFSLMFWIAFGAAASAPAIASLVKPRETDAASWLAGARTLLGLAIGLTAVLVVVSLIELIGVLTLASGSYQSVGSWIGALVLALFFGVISLVGGIVVRAMLAAGSRQSYIVGTAYAALLFVFGLVLVIIWSVQGLGGFTSLILIVAFGLPAGLVALLWGPTSTRRQFASLAPVGVPTVVGTVGTAVPQTAPQPAQTVAGFDAVRAEAADPATPALRLQEIAATVPEARAAIAANPSTYPDLLVWLGTLGQPDVDAALTQRS